MVRLPFVFFLFVFLAISIDAFTHLNGRSSMHTARRTCYKKSDLFQRRWHAFRLSAEANSEVETTISNDQLEALISQVKAYEIDAVDSIKSANTAKEVELFRVAFLGKKGKLSGMMKEMRSLPKEIKPKFGEVVNVAVANVEQIIETTRVELEEREWQERLQQDSLGNAMDISPRPFIVPGIGRRHPIPLTLELTTRIFEDIGYEIISGPASSPEIENDFYNFEALGMPFSHPARDMQDTFYIDTTGLNTTEQLLLRTHTSAVQIREMEKRTPPFKICAPGRVYRKDDVDATHYPVFHQVEILAIDEIGKLTLPHLLGTVKHFLKEMFGPDVEVKYRASYFPFTEPSIEVDVFFKGKWLEVLGCGMVDPVVLESVGYDPTKYAGFAAGFGIERFAMIMHNITDIRLFWENNIEFIMQFPPGSYRTAGEYEGEELLMKSDTLPSSYDDLLDGSK